jgi:hypothetical protein
VTPDGTGLVYSGFLGRGTSSIRVKVAADAGGSAYVFADDIANPADFPAGGRPATRLGEFGEVLVAKVPASGQGLEWSTLFGGSNAMFPRGLAIDPAGDVYLMGDTSADQSTIPVQGGPSLTRTPQLDQEVFVARLHGTPGNGDGGGGGGGGGALCVDPTVAQLQAVLPDPSAAPDRKRRKVGKVLGRLACKAGKAINKGLPVGGAKKERQFARATRALNKLLAKARAADAKGRLAASLAPIEAEANELLVLLS